MRVPRSFSALLMLALALTLTAVTFAEAGGEKGDPANDFYGPDGGKAPQDVIERRVRYA